MAESVSVAPLVGAWIEMTNIILTVRTIPSLLSWERGLKSCSKLTQVWLIYVAPLVGAWIEIEDLLNMKLADMVAPLVGAWIEITTLQHCDIEALVAPLVGAWIEILLAGHYEMATMVAPLVGAWIEIKSEIYKVLYVSSLLSWERGLKFNQGGKVTSHFGRSSRGSVD